MAAILNFKMAATETVTEYVQQGVLHALFKSCLSYQHFWSTLLGVDMASINDDMAEDMRMECSESRSITIWYI